MQQSVISDYTKESIISATLNDEVEQFILENQRLSIYQIAQHFDLEPSEVIKIYEGIRNGN